MSEPSPNANRRRLRRWAPRPTRSPRNRRRVHPFHIACRIALTGLAGYGLWVAFHSPALKIRRVEVVGAQRLGAERVRQLAAIPLGRNIFQANLYRARLAVESSPQVASAMVSRALPNTVRIAVQERRPVFVVCYNGGFFETDEAGIPFYQVPKSTRKLPLLALRNVGPVQL